MGRKGLLERLFKLKENGTSVKTEILAGLTTFITIANGIDCGIITYPIMELAIGKRKEIHPLMYILAALFILRYILIPQ